MRAMAQMGWAVLPAAAGSGWGEGPWGWGMHPMWGVWGFGMMIFMLIFWVVVIAGAVALVRWLWRADGGRRPAAGAGGSAEEILRRRYARGEIDREEFRARLQDLRGA